MSQAVKVSDEVMALLREAAALQSRSIAGQAEHWLRLGRAFERDPRFGFTQVEQALRGLVPPMDLSESQQEDYFDRLEERLLAPSAKATAFFEDRRRRGVGVGMDEAGNMVYEGSRRS